MSEQSKSKDQPKIGDYFVGKTIGKGTFGKVKIGTHSLTGENVAIKILEKSKIVDDSDQARVTRQIDILRKIRHPNIVQLYQIIETPSRLFLIMEYADGGELFEEIVANHRLNQVQAGRYLQQMLNAVEYLHELGIVHRDLKPENLLLDFKKNIKVVDFGLSNMYQKGQELVTACGSPCYAAPEMISGATYEGLKTDLWSCGIILFAMICGYLPFEDADTNKLYKKIRAGYYELPGYVSDRARDLLSKILNVNRQERATIQEIRNHAFCSQQEKPVRGVIQKVYAIQPEQQIILELSKFEFTGVREQILRNKHNKITATYYLLLKNRLKAKDKSLLDYYREKEFEYSTKKKSKSTVIKRKRTRSDVETHKGIMQPRVNSKQQTKRNTSYRISIKSKYAETKPPSRQIHTDVKKYSTNVPVTNFDTLQESKEIQRLNTIIDNKLQLTKELKRSLLPDTKYYDSTSKDVKSNHDKLEERIHKRNLSKLMPVRQL